MAGIETLDIKVRPSNEVSDRTWHMLQRIYRRAFIAGAEADPSAATMTLDEIDALTMWDQQSRYTTSHQDFNSEVGRSVPAGNYYYHQQVAVAEVNGRVVGFMDGALNVSANSLLLRYAKLGLNKHYQTLRTGAVAEEFQGKGIATKMAARLLGRTLPWAPAVTYVYKSLNQGLYGRLVRKGFEDTGTLDEEQPFGVEGRVVPLHRLQHPSVRGLRRSLHTNH